MKKIIILFFLFSTYLAGNAQNSKVPSTYGKEFYMMFFQNYAFNYTTYIDISARDLSTIRIKSPFKDTTILVLPGIPYTYIIPGSPSVLPYEALTPLDRSVYVQSDKDISVIAYNSAQRSTDGSLILPVHLLGNNYLLATYNELEFPAFGGIVATEDNTEVEIIPSQDFISTFDFYPAGEPFKVKLNKGEAYLLNSSDPTGTVIRTTDPCKKIAVFGGAQCTYVQTPFCDHLFEQIWPVNYMGKKFYTVPLMVRKFGDTFRFLGSRDRTTVKILGKKSFMINAGQAVDMLIDKPSVIESTEPIALYQLSNGSAYDSPEEFGDPFIANVMPADQGVDFITFTTTNQTAEDSVYHYINITTRTDNINTVILDSNLLYNNFKPFPDDPTYSYAQVEVDNILDPLPIHALVSTGGVNALVYGFGFHYSYGYGVGGIVNSSYIDFSYDPVTCTQKEIQFLGDDEFIVGPRDYFWSFGDGSTSNVKNPTHVYQAPGSYIVKFKVFNKSNCVLDSTIKIIEVKVAEITKPSVTTSGNHKICKGGFAQLSASGGKYYSWFPTEGLDNPQIANPTASPKKATRYVVTVSADSLCSYDTASVMVSFVPLPKAKAMFTINKMQVTFEGSDEDDVNEWIWSLGDGSPTRNTKQFTHTYAQKGVYKVKMIGKRSCGDENFVDFEVKIDGSIKDEDSVINDDTDPNTGLLSTPINQKKIKVYPNPLENNFKIESDETVVRVELYDIVGRKVEEWGAGNTTYTLRWMMQPGNYLLRVQLKNNEFITERVVISR